MKKSGWIIAVTILAVIAGYFGYRSYLRSQREHKIFCETLAPGMSQHEVFDSLKTFGEISYSNEHIRETGYDEIAVGYIDSGVVGQHTYILSFQDGRYTGVSVIVWLDDVESVC